MAYSYRELVRRLADSGAASPQTEARQIINRFCGIPYADILAEPDGVCDGEGLDAAVEKRCGGYPLQYILGECGFCRGVFKVTEDTLIPRADTELLVETAASRIPKNARFIDLCTGSGCVAISLLMEREDLTGVATDISEGALRVATENARINSVGQRLRLTRADVMHPDSVGDLAPFDAIISNPPYISSSVIPTLDREVLNEPIIALDGGEDGLDFYRVIIKEYGNYLTDGGIMIFEIGYDQGEALVDLSEESGFLCEIIKDYGGNDRVACLTAIKK